MSKVIFVKDVMSPRVRTVAEGKTVYDAAKLMAKWRIGSLVVTKGDTPVGVITEGDVSRCVAKGLDPRRTPAKAGRRKLVTADPADRLEVAARTMAAAGVKKLPVIDGTRLVGIITQTDIVDSTFELVTSLKEMVRARFRPPDFEP